ncbi:MAG: ABC transporter ATP-binding protein [Rhizobiaceae bacterium]|nr:ABC transporter ATP-binding protein [Rhizobiaceae bacterium]
MASVVVRDVSLNFGVVEVLKSLNIEVNQGEFLVLLGPSGCGKSTLLNCIAGLLEVTDGQIFINGKNVTWEQPKDRGIGMVFQSYALYPQMSVEGNLSFGLKNQRLPADEIASRVKRASEILQIEPLLKRKPMALSGGQRQRVAIGRALVRDVDVFLFDEPLSNLDAKLRNELRIEIKRLHQKLENTMIYVTHDQIEAMTLADRIAVMRDGIIQQLDEPQAIYSRPVNRFVAGFIGSPGMNFMEGTLEVSGSPKVKVGDATIDAKGYDFDKKPEAGQKVVFGIRPEHVMIGEMAKSMPYTSEVEIEIVEPMGSDTLSWTKLGGQNFTFRIDSEYAPKEGEKVKIGFDPARASIFDANTDIRL